MVELVSFPGNRHASVAMSLRKIADDVEKGVYGDMRCALVILDEGLSKEVHLFGLGSQSDPDRVVFAMEKAKAWLIHQDSP